MKRIISILILLGIAAGVLAANPFLMVIARKNAGGGITYIVEEDFEGAGAPTGFTSGTGTIDFDHTGTVLEGSESVQIETGERLDYTSLPGGAQSTISAFYVYRHGGTPAVNSTIIQLRSSGSNEVSLQQRTTDVIRVFDSAFTGIGDIAVSSTAETLYIWIEYTAGSGTDAVISVYVSSTTTKGAADASTTGAASTGSIDNARIYATSLDAVFDDWKLSTETIGDAP